MGLNVLRILGVSGIKVTRDLKMEICSQMSQFILGRAT